MAQTRIVVGVDGSTGSKQALDWAVRQAESTGAAVEAVIAWRYPTTYGAPMPVLEDYDPEGDARRVLHQMVTEVAGSGKVPVRETTTEGRAAPVLLAAAEGAELLVVGSRGLGAFRGMLLGSVGDQVVRHAPCPVTVVRNTGRFEEPD